MQLNSSQILENDKHLNKVISNIIFAILTYLSHMPINLKLSRVGRDEIKTAGSAQNILKDFENASP